MMDLVSPGRLASTSSMKSRRRVSLPRTSTSSPRSKARAASQTSTSRRSSTKKAASSPCCTKSNPARAINHSAFTVRNLRDSLKRCSKSLAPRLKNWKTLANKAPSAPRRTSTPTMTPPQSVNARTAVISLTTWREASFAPVNFSLISPPCRSTKWNPSTPSRAPVNSKPNSTKTRARRHGSPTLFPTPRNHAHDDTFVTTDTLT
mmetsp:Transcript_6184/g.22305  ORF Transcript_6184/g.22305 Transcript_6184/m.22305 type:complete len:205 (-) Transcript_6184:12-626(-)